jgi:hypothetical protein
MREKGPQKIKDFGGLKVKFIAIPALIFLIILAPIVKLIAFNREYFGLTDLEYILVAIVISLILSVPLIWLSFRKTARSSINLFLSLFLIASVLTSFVIPVSLGAIDGINSVSLKIRTEAFIAFILTILIFINLMILARFKTKYFEKIVVVINSLKLFCVFYVSAFFIYTVLSGPISFSFSGEKFSSNKAQMSKDKNIFIVSFDQIQGSTMREYLSEHQENSPILDGFTFFTDAAATYPNTNYSISSMLLGRIVKNKSEDYNYALSSDTSILDAVEGEGFRIKTNDFLKNKRYDCVTCGTPSFNFVKSYELLRHAINLGFGLDITRLGLTLPQRQYGAIPAELVDHVWKIDLHKFQQFSESMVVSKDKPSAYFMHFTGTHQPFIYNGDCTLKTLDEISKAQNPQGAKEQISCVFNLLKEFIDNLKVLGVYDNSLIIFLSDHGYEQNIYNDSANNDERYLHKILRELGDSRNIKPVGSYNPFLMFKPKGSRGALVLKDSPVSLIDIAPTICEAIGCESQWEGTSLFNDVPEWREREFWQYVGGTDRRAPDGSDKLHDGLEVYWEKKIFRGPILPNLVFAMGLSKEKFEILYKIYTLGEKIYFNQGGRSSVYVVSGWSGQEGIHRWTDGKEATLKLSLNKPPTRDLILKIDGVPFLGGSLAQQLTKIFVNNVEVGLWKMHERGWYEVGIPLELVRNGDLDIVFQISQPTAPCDISDSMDCRKLGIGVLELVIIEKDKSH